MIHFLPGYVGIAKSCLIQDQQAWIGAEGACKLNERFFRAAQVCGGRIGRTVKADHVFEPLCLFRILLAWNHELLLPEQKNIFGNR